MRRRQNKYSVIFLFLFVWVSQAVSQESMPRVVLILYQFNEKDPTYLNGLSRILETPLNHLGLVVEYHDIGTGFPDIDKRSDIRGILSWYDQGILIQNPSRYVRWLVAQIEKGRKIVIMEEPGFLGDYKNWPTRDDDIDALFEKLGVQSITKEMSAIFDIEVTYKNPQMLEFERELPKTLTTLGGSEWIQVVDGKAQPHLQASDGNHTIALVVTNQNGGYVSDNYSMYRYGNKDQTFRFWYINPFEFFRLAFDLEDVPAPDTTTLFGNRLYYSHIDGDGWNNVTQLEEYKGEDTLCAEIIYEKIFKKFPDMPVTVGPIGADLDLEWVGLHKSGEIARRIFKLSHIEPASHTYSHPFSWEFFQDGNINKEKKYFDYYSLGDTWGTTREEKNWFYRLKNFMRSFLPKKKRVMISDSLKVIGGYDIPRAYAHKPFDLSREIEGSCSLINRFTPPGKPVKILLWSGDTRPFLAAMRKVVALEIQNLNGGDNRFDWENYSYSWIAPKGRKVGEYWQIYASTANETVYTNGWEERFYAYRDLIQTLHNTETPLRLLPLNIYYHMYIGEKKASLDALLENIHYARQQDICPVPTSEYAKIVQGFYKTRLIPLAKDQWQVQDRGALRTLRFDKALLKGVDFSSSQGVIGQKHFQGSLYVFLDQQVSDPVITLKDINAFGSEPEESVLYLIQSNWIVEGYKTDPLTVTFTAQGFGKGKLALKTPPHHTYKILVKRDQAILHQSSVISSEEGTLNVSLPVIALEPVEVTLTVEKASHA